MVQKNRNKLINLSLLHIKVFIIFGILINLFKQWQLNWDGTYPGTAGTDYPDQLSYFTIMGYSTWSKSQMDDVNFISGTTASTDPATLTATRCSTECCATSDNDCYGAYNKNGELVNEPSEPKLIIFGGQDSSGTLQSQLWSYSIREQTFTPIVYSGTGPSARQFSQAVYYEVQSTSTYSQLSGSSVTYTRKYMYIYGGECSSGILCTTNLFWRYEIPFAGQYYYPDIDQRGNYWEQISAEDPGPRKYHQLIINSDYIYLFGGVDDNSNTNFKNDLWKFDLSTQTWTEISYKVFDYIVQTLVLWDSTTTTYNNQDFNAKIQSTDTITYQSTYMTGGTCPDQSDTKQVYSIPPCRGSPLFSFYGDNLDQILIYGGKNSANILNDTWIIQIDHSDDTGIWTQQTRTDLDISNYPDYKYNIKYVNDQNLNFSFMFGPYDETNTATNQFWAFKNKRAVWSQINPEYIYNNPIWPSASSDFSITMSSGYSILQSSTTIFNHIVIMIGCDGSACTNQIYVMSQDDCNQSYINNGECRYGYFICNENYYDKDCSSPMCPGSICIYNSDTFDVPYCIYCKGQGSCSGGTCSCSQTLYTEGNLYFENSSCENVDCYKSCSNQGDCISYFPENQCRCDQEDQIGGDYCENIFCLNDCSDHGTCSSGICSCDNSDQNYLGADCSVLGIVFLEDNAKILVFNFIQVIILFITFNFY